MDLLLLKIINKENDFEFDVIKKYLIMQFKCIITLESFIEKVQILFIDFIQGCCEEFIKGKK